MEEQGGHDSPSFGPYPGGRVNALGLLLIVCAILFIEVNDD